MCLLNELQSLLYNIKGINSNFIGSDNIAEYGFNSISFISYVVSIEVNYDIEFDEEYLNYKKFLSFSQLVDYVNNLIIEKKRGDISE